MGLRSVGARALSALSTVALKQIFHRPAANFPGKLALYLDPQIISHSVNKLICGSIVVVGTNGKTTTTNLLADALQAHGCSVLCNRSGANLDSGIATALLHGSPSDWGVFESDELWLARSLPQLQANYVLLLNLFRDQLDRCGEIDRIQDSIVEALAASPHSILVYNADDPLCATIAKRAAELEQRRNTPSVAFGVAEDMGLTQNKVVDAQMCQWCSSMLSYDFRTYGQLGDYHCPKCGFSRPQLDVAAENIQLASDGLAFDCHAGTSAQVACWDAGLSVSQQGVAFEGSLHITGPFSGAYMVYNLLAVGVAAQLVGCAPQALQQAIDSFDPQNGRLQEMQILGHSTLLNLAKNPTGFNQNLKIIAQESQPKTVAFFINDREADGRDISWLWDIDFEELAALGDVQVFVGGIRRNDMQLRLKYAAIQAELVDDVEEVVRCCRAEDKLYVIANYTALPAVKSQLDALSMKSDVSQKTQVQVVQPVKSRTEQSFENATVAAKTVITAVDDSILESNNPLRIAHLFPDLLNLYGDLGNVRVLVSRCEQRNIPVEVVELRSGESLDLSTVDLVFLGGGPDREQRLASKQLLAMKGQLKDFVESDGVLLAICGGYQILGSEWLLGDESVEGLGIIDLVTKRGGTRRLINNIALSSPLAIRPVVGYENHAGRTYLGEGVQPFGRVISKTGNGNNDTDETDGVRYRNVIGTYLHGPLLGKNPEIADWLLTRALERKTGETVKLTALDDTVEHAANEYMAKRLIP